MNNSDNRSLASYATFSKSSKGRMKNENKTDIRTCFQRDRDRILHSSAFRRLKHKTQVFLNEQGDYYRTRLTHTLEVSQISRSIAFALNLNEDLTEAIALSHDLGHPPFGHAGEEALNECMNDHGGFDHNLQTLRIVMFIENKYLKFKGLNLTLETLDGLLKHNGPFYEKEKLQTIIGIKNLKNKLKLDKNASLEAQIASISDDIAYNNHDIQDGIKAKLFTLRELTEIDFFKEIYNSYKRNIKNNNKEIIVYQIIRDSINLMVQDVIKKTIYNIKVENINNISNIYSRKKKIVEFSTKFKFIENQIKLFLKDKMYNNKNVLNKNNNGKNIIKKIFKIIKNNPRKFIRKSNLNENKFRAISDYISGMTDRFAINLYNTNK